MQDDVKEMTMAMYRYDAESILNRTHPMIIDNLGGRNAAIASMETGFENIKQSHLRFESLEFPKPPTFLESEDHFFTIVPTEMILAVGGQRVLSSAFQFGVRKKNDFSWKYIDGMTVSRVTATALFEDFPADYELPITKQTPLTDSPGPADDADDSSSDQSNAGTN